MLATLDDLLARVPSLTDTQLAEAEAVLADVSASVVRYCGQRFVRGEVTVRARVKRGMVRLSQRPVHDVISVTDRFGAAITYTWDGLDRVHVDPYRSGRAPLQVVDVTYDAGPDEVPPDIVGIVRSITLRTLGADPLDAGVTQESVDGYSYTLGSVAGAGAYGLLPGEKLALDSYRRQFGTIQAAW